MKVKNLILIKENKVIFSSMVNKIEIKENEISYRLTEEEAENSVIDSEFERDVIMIGVNADIYVLDDKIEENRVLTTEEMIELNKINLKDDYINISELEELKILMNEILGGGYY